MDEEESGQHRCIYVSGIYMLYQDIHLKYEETNNSLFNTVSPKCFLEIEPAGSFLKNCIAFHYYL